MSGSRSTHRRLITTLVLGLVLALAPLGWWVTHRSGGPATYNSGAAAGLADGSPGSSTGVPASSPASVRKSSLPPSSSSVPSPSRSSGSTPSSSERPVASTRTAPGSSTRTGEPIRIRIASIDVAAPVDAVGVDRTGDMAIPDNVERVGWYRWGPRPGSGQGSIVLAGHVDSAVQGLGAMFRLRQISRGSSITVTTTSGRNWHYRVVALEEFPKTTIPLDKIFSRTGAPRLTVITCGGQFDASTRSYDDNIVVTGVPA
ncbi:MAG: class F sortase [bacterium]